MIKYIDFTTGNDILDESLENYLMYGISPGGFLTAVLTNNLYLAATRADHFNKSRIPEITQAIIYNMPAQSYGTASVVDEWIKDKDNRRSSYARFLEKQYTWNSLKGLNNEKEYSSSSF